MKLKIVFQLIRAATTFSRWYKKASEDGVITPAEISEFLTEFAEIFGITINLKLPESLE